MLNLMRKHASSWIIKVLLGLITVTFVFFFGYGYREKRKQEIASVNGAAISYDEYSTTLRNLQEQTRQRFGGSMSDDLLKMMKLEQQALDMLIDNRVLMDEARRLNIRISDQELIDSIRKIGSFQTGDKFDHIRYERLLRLNGLTKEMFEAEQKGRLLIEKLQSFISENIKVSDLEILDWYKWNGTTVDIDYVLFDPTKYKDIAPSDKEISDYYEEHKSKYKTEMKVKIRYLNFDPKDYKKDVTVMDKEVKDYYEMNPEEFINAKTVEARHILFRVANDAKPETVEKVRKKATDVLKLTREGKDFIELAKEYSEGPTKDKGGYLGAFKKETMVKPFADKAFSMKPGEISDLVRTQFGWHIIKVDKVNQESTTPFDQAKVTIRKNMIDERANLLAGEEAQEVYDASFEGDDLIRTAKDKNLNVLSTDFFTSRGPKEALKHKEKIAEAALKLDVMEISEILDLGDILCILQVTDKIPEEISPLENVKNEITRDLIKELQDKKVHDDAKNYLAALKAGESMTNKKGNIEIIVNHTGFFKRTGSIPKIGYEKEISDSAFKLSNQNKLPKEVKKGKNGYYVIQFRAKKGPLDANFDKEKESIQKNLLQQKKRKVLEEWLVQLKNRSEIKTNSDFLE